MMSAVAPRAKNPGIQVSHLRLGKQTKSTNGWEKGKRPLPSHEIMLDGDASLLSLRSTQRSATQLIDTLTDVPLLSGAGARGAEGRCVEFEFGAWGVDVGWVKQGILSLMARFRQLKADPLSLTNDPAERDRSRSASTGANS
jgi:hypothetical protein